MPNDDDIPSNVLDAARAAGEAAAAAYGRRHHVSDDTHVGSSQQRTVRNVTSHILAQVKSFSGDNDNEYPWESFMLALDIAELNQTYSEQERKQVLFQNLDGSARMFLLANKQLMKMDYETIKATFAENFSTRKAQGMVKLQSLTQQPQETVLRFVSRIRGVAATIDPYIFDDESQDPTIHALQKGRADMLEFVLLNQFKQGLRSDIRGAMRTDTFKTLDDAVKAAQEAEIFLEATSVRVNHVEASDEYTNFAGADSRQIQKMNLRSPTGRASSSEKGVNKGFKGKCYNCNEFAGHLARDCPHPRRKPDEKNSKNSHGKGKGKKGKQNEKHKNTKKVSIDLE